MILLEFVSALTILICGQQIQLWPRCVHGDLALVEYVSLGARLDVPYISYRLVSTIVYHGFFIFKGKNRAIL